jgi:hypothetical protein
MIDPARRIAGQRSESSGSLVLALRVAEQGRTASNQGAERKRDRSGKPEAKCDTVEGSRSFRTMERGHERT